MTRFQIYPETEFAFKYTKPFCKTQYSEIFLEYEQGFDMNIRKIVKKTTYTTSYNKRQKIINPSKTSKKHRKHWWKSKTTRQRQYTPTGTITHEQHLF